MTVNGLRNTLIRALIDTSQCSNARLRRVKYLPMIIHIHDRFDNDIKINSTETDVN